jgi:ferredoxin
VSSYEDCSSFEPLSELRTVCLCCTKGGEQSLEYDYNPDDELRVQVERAAVACPVQAISIGQADDPKSSGRLISFLHSEYISKHPEEQEYEF